MTDITLNNNINNLEKLLNNRIISENKEKDDEEQQLNESQKSSTSSSSINHGIEDLGIKSKLGIKNLEQLDLCINQRKLSPQCLFLKIFFLILGKSKRKHAVHISIN